MPDHDDTDPCLASRAAAGCAEARLLMSRRAMLGLTAGLFSAAVTPSFAANTPSGDPRLLVVVLRGGLDGINTVVPHGDRHYAGLRGDVAFARGDTLPLDGFFGLNPAMPKFGKLFARGEAAVVHATCTPLRNRSHFDAQDNLENGLPGPASNATGWLNRLLAALPSGERIRKRGAIEIGDAPLILRGPAPVLGWSPTWFRPLDDDTLGNVRDIYRAEDPDLLRMLDRGIAADKLAAGGDEDDDDVGTLRKGFRGAGRLLARGNGPRIAVLSVDGFDTHSQQGLATGSLAGMLSTLDTALDDFRTRAGKAWRQTVVVCVTEFGRSVRANGDRGTDHGVGTVALLAGGAVRGGRVVCDWPGLAPAKLFEGDDLRATTDLRAVFKGILLEHLDVPRTLLDRQIFPDSGGVAPLRGLVRSPASASTASMTELAAAADVPVRPPSALALYRRAGHGIVARP